MEKRRSKNIQNQTTGRYLKDLEPRGQREHTVSENKKSCTRSKETKAEPQLDEAMNTMLASEQNRRRLDTKTDEKAYKSPSICEERSEGSLACFVRCEMMGVKKSTAGARKRYGEGGSAKEMTPHKQVKW